MIAASSIQIEFNASAPSSRHHTRRCPTGAAPQPRKRSLAMNKIALIATGLLIATSAAASAHDIDATRDRQADRIEQGRETGKITWTEGLALRAEQRKIARTEANYEEKGYMTKS